MSSLDYSSQILEQIKKIQKEQKIKQEQTVKNLRDKISDIYKESKNGK